MKNRPIKSIILSLSITAIITTAIIAKAEPIVTIDAASIDSLITELTAIAQKTAPQAPTAMLPSMLGMAIQNPGLIGIDRTKPVQIQIFLPENQPIFNTEPAISLHIPLLEDGKHYLALLEQSMGKPVIKDDIMAFTPATGDSLYIKIDDDYAIISDNQKAVKIAEDLSSDTLLDITGTVRLGLSPEKLIPYLKLSKTEMASAMKNQPANPAMPMDTEKVINAEMDALIAILEQIDAMALGIKINKSNIDITSRITPVAGSVIAKMYAQQKAPSAKYVSLAPANALYATSGSGINAFDLAIEPYTKLITGIYSAMGPEYSKLAPMINKMMNDYKGLYSGDFAMGVTSTGKNIGFYEVAALNDVAKAKKMMNDNIAAYNKDFGDIIKGISINVDTNRTYNKVDIQRISYNIDQKAMNLPTPMPAMDWLSKMKFEIAYIDNNMLYSIGGKDVMNSLIDRFNSKKISPSPSAQFTKLIPTVKGTPVQSYTLSISRIIKTLLLMSPNATDAMFTGSTATGGIAGYATIDDKDCIGLDRISIDEIMAIKDMVPTIQSTLMGLMMSTQMQMQTAPAPAHSGCCPAPTK